jgi:putative transposase
MPNTYSQIYLHIVFAVKRRESLIPKQHKEELHKYISGLVQHRNAKMLAIHCMPDHVHMLIGALPTLFIPNFVKEIKVESNEFINQKRWTNFKFEWQEGYGVFSYSRATIDTVIKYINNQEEHHRTRSFQEEYVTLLNELDIDFEHKYLFDFFN